MTRPKVLLILAACTVALLLPAASAAARQPTCTPVRGRVTDAATGLPLGEVTSVEIYLEGAPYDGGATNTSSRWSACFPEGDYTIYFHADHYRPEWYEDQPDQASATVIHAAGTSTIVANTALTPRGRVLTGRVLSMNGAPRDASVSIWRLTERGWRSIDGLGTDRATGTWSFTVPHLGRYRIAAGVDHYWSRWYDGDTRLRFARVVVVNEGTVFVNGLDIRVPYCGAAPVMCEPAGFLT